MLYKDKTQSMEARVEDLLSRMTLEEKAAQLCGDLPMFAAMGEITDEAMREKYPDGHGRFTQFSTLGLASAEQIAHIANQIQKWGEADLQVALDELKKKEAEMEQAVG